MITIRDRDRQARDQNHPKNAKGTITHF